MFFTRVSRGLFAPSAVLVLFSAPLGADEGRADAQVLLDLLRVPETLEIMRDEGMSYAQTLATDMMPGPAGTSWVLSLDRIYDLDRMEATVADGFSEAILTRDVNAATLQAFFGGALGSRIIGLEVSARRAMSDEGVEDAAREAYRDARAADADETDTRLAQLDAMIESNDLIEANVVGGMNSSVQFYQGLADGGAIDLGEADILAQVWSSEDETREDTAEWLYGYLLMAYGPLQDAELDAYLDVLDSPAGRALNQALFAGFDTMFSDISYALGRALAREMQAEEL